MTTDLLDPTDIIMQSPDLTPEDRDIAKEIYSKNMAKFDKKMKKGSKLFAEVDETEFVERLGGAVKAVLNHRLKLRTGGL